MKIAFGYKMGVGKDTCADYLIEKYSGSKVSFAKPIYQILHYAQQVCNFDKEKDRKFLQNVGDWAREKEQNVWVRLAMESCNDNKSNYFVSDLRYMNEFKSFKDDGWKCVKINRTPPKNREGTGSISHKSEIDLDQIPDDKWDLVIDNNGTFEDLYKTLDELYLLN